MVKLRVFLTYDRRYGTFDVKKKNNKTLYLRSNFQKLHNNK